MSSGWRKARLALGLHVCVSAPAEPADEENGETGNSSPGTPGTPSPGPAVSPRSAAPSTRSPSRLQLIRTSIRLSRSTCAICLEQMKPGLGHALFTAECSHTFHFSCIASNVRHGNLVCPVCRARWKEVPWQAPSEAPNKASSPRPRRSSSSRQLQQSSGSDGAPDADDDELRRLDPVLRILDESIASARGIRRVGSAEPTAFDDDEALSAPGGSTTEAAANGLADSAATSYDTEQDQLIEADNLDITCHAEVDSICHSEARDNFTVLVNVKALSESSLRQLSREVAAGTEDGETGTGSRAPIDLITVLDVSGSMAGTKLMLLKQAMGFVIRNLSPSDRLSVVAFSSTAKRLFPLRRMVEEGRQQALRSIDSLVSTGGTNIAEGLRKGAKILEDRRQRNPIASIMLLSDGQDTHSLGSRSTSQMSRSGSLRRTISGRQALYGNVAFPVHTFGFGADHDSATMHTIAEASGGTFSFIQAEAAVQDAFAQCIGGLLSVVVQDVRLCLSSVGENVQLRRIQAGSYEKSVAEQGSSGCVKLGDLYAEEERDILLELSIPSFDRPLRSMKVLSAECSFREPVSQRLIRTKAKSLEIRRPSSIDKEKQSVSVQVDRQRNRLRTAQTIVEAGSLADRGDLGGAQQALQNAKMALRSSAASQAGDNLSTALESELTEIQVRMANRQMYERSGRAYALSAQSSHFRQRATARGDYVDSQSRDYQTPSMVDMILRSQTLPTFPEEPAVSAAAPAAASSSRSRSLSRKASGKVHDVEK